jgi:hypothetical protein
VQGDQIAGLRGKGQHRDLRLPVALVGRLDGRPPQEHDGERRAEAEERPAPIRQEQEREKRARREGGGECNTVLETVGATRPEVARVAKSFKERDVKVFMLANQLPLLQSGLEPASVRDAATAYCRPDGAHYSDRLFKETDLIAFSDPNDLLSYPIPDAFVRDYVDSRLCPVQVNVTINVAPVTNLIGLGEFANPLSAHVDYDDERVIGLITRGIGQPETAPAVKERCTWLEIAEDLR